MVKKSRGSGESPNKSEIGKMIEDGYFSQAVFVLFNGNS